MASPVEQLYKKALTLSDKSRGDLAARLIDSLDPSVEESVEPAWAEEIGRRLQEIDQGKTKLIPWRRARKMILQDKNGKSAR